MTHRTGKAPLATYRVQLTAAFGFDAAADAADYLARLGVSHLYASPCLQARPGSTHGYDATRCDRVNPELGGEPGRRRLVNSLRRAGLGMVLDIVPNHMAADAANPLWQDVLANGPHSRWAGVFDINWQRDDPRLRGKVLLPVLGEQYAQAVRQGKLALRREGGRFFVAYYEHQFPLNPSTVERLLTQAAERANNGALNELAKAFAAAGGSELPLARTEESLHRPVPVEFMPQQEQQTEQAIEQRLSTDAAAAGLVDRLLGEVNSQPERLDEVLEEQHYRLAHWRTAFSELNYRRFFSINDLVGVRVEDEQVFDLTHRLWLEWVRQGELDGLRVDHPDGLRDPKGYLDRLRERAGDAWIVVEKILEPGEELPRDWPVGGTTGYDFLNQVGGLFVDPAGERAMTRLYAEFTGQPTDYAELVRQKKLLLLDRSFGGELARLTGLLAAIASRRLEGRDFARGDLLGAIRQLVACFGVYRTYIRPGQAPGSDDRRYIQYACELARRKEGRLEAIFDFLRGLLTTPQEGSTEQEFILRLQQLTGPAMAKGVEDTAFYCYNRLVSLNEVGGDPGRFGLGVEGFHRWCERMQRDWPQTLLATATHDTKRGEDVRLRISLLSEIPQRWQEAVRRWSARNARHRLGGWYDANAEYLLYQTLVGLWPIERERLTEYVLKAAHEAKMHTSWIEPDADYERGLTTFVEGVIGDAEFTADLEAFLAPLLWPARISSLAQTLIKLTAPGVPDFYQGSELWDLSLVDPDNRRPVDFALRRRLLSELDGLSPAGAMARMDDALPKMLVVRKALAARRRLADCFGPDGAYRKLGGQGAKEKHLLAFVRGERVATVVPRLTVAWTGDWGDTQLHLPAGTWVDEFTGRTVTEERVRLKELLADFPVALLVKQ